MKYGKLAFCWGLTGVLILFGMVTGAEAEERYHTWSAGLRGGPSVLTQDAVDDLSIDGQIGPLFNGVVVYDLDRYFSLGFEAEWEQHKLDQGSLTLGKASTASLLIRFEAYLDRSQPISPYFLFAGGYNMNFFSEDDAYLAACGEDCSIDVDNSFTIKAGFGADMLILFENAAINVEVAWKHNKADLDFFSGGTQVGSDDYNGSALELLVGFRYRFPAPLF